MLDEGSGLRDWIQGIPDAQAPLTFKGVVFNEMKGVYSSPDSMNQRHTQQAMFPDNTYAVDSGGDPVDIPNLSFDECAPAGNTVLDGLELAAVCGPAVQPMHKGMLENGFAGRQPSRTMQCGSDQAAACRFKAFHERYYHPSNARFWFYGDDPPAERLRLLAAYLDEFEAQPVDSAVSAQPLFQVQWHRRTHACQWS